MHMCVRDEEEEGGGGDDGRVEKKENEKMVDKTGNCQMNVAQSFKSKNKQPIRIKSNSWLSFCVFMCIIFFTFFFVSFLCVCAHKLIVKHYTYSSIAEQQ